MDLESALADWRALLGAPQVQDGTAAQTAYGSDTSGAQRRLSGALRPQQSEQLVPIMQIAHRHRVPVYPISTGHNWGYGTALPACDDCVILDLSGLNRIVDFDAELGVVTLEPGVTQAMLADYLDRGSHPYMVPVTGAGPQCSLLGNALERGYGITPHTDHFAAVTDIEAVLADGSLYRTSLREAGGEDLARLFKAGIGPYSVGLFSQSGFGVVSRMSIVLARRPDCVKVCLFSLKDDRLLEEAVSRIHTLLVRLPGIVGGINLMNQRRVLAMSAPYPADRLDAQGLIPEPVLAELGRQYQIFPWTGFGTLYGTHRVVGAAQREIRQTLAGIASRLLFIGPERAVTLAKLSRHLPGSRGKALAKTVGTLAKSLELVAGRPNETALPLAYWRNPNPAGTGGLDPARDGCGLSWYAPLVPMRPEGVRRYVTMATRITKAHGIEPLITLTSINDRIFDSTLPILFDRAHPPAVARAQACYQALLEEGRQQGHFPYRFGVDAMPTVAQYQTHSLAFHQRLRASLDPYDLLSPGRYNRVE